MTIELRLAPQWVTADETLVNALMRRKYTLQNLQQVRARAHVLGLQQVQRLKQCYAQSA